MMLAEAEAQASAQRELSLGEVVAKKGHKQEYWTRLIVNGPVPIPSSALNALDLTTSPCGTPPMAKHIQAHNTKILVKRCADMTKEQKQNHSALGHFLAKDKFLLGMD
eukprot:2693822-Ditylum_brightwellii.AAC.1